VGALADLLAETKALMRTIPGFEDRVSGPGPAPQLYPWMVVRTDRGEGLVQARMRDVAHAFAIFVLYGAFDGVSQEEAEALAIGHYETILAAFEQHVVLTEESDYRSEIAYEIGRVEWGAQAYYALVLRPRFQLYEEVEVRP
jgi:hypothetical protein